MPSPWSSSGSIDDATALANRLALRTHTVPIQELMQGFDDASRRRWATHRRVTARTAVPHPRHPSDGRRQPQGRLLLTTGNKSELAVAIARCTAT